MSVGMTRRLSLQMLRAGVVQFDCAKIAFGEKLSLTKARTYRKEKS